MDTKPVQFKRRSTEESASFDRNVIDYIQNAAAHGLYEIRGLGAKRRVPHFDDLLFLAGSLSATHWKAIAKNALPKPCSAHALRRNQSSSTFQSPSPA